MARRCTVFTLPPEAFLCIATKLKACDLFKLSTCSKRSFNLVKNTAVLFESVRYKNYANSDIYICIPRLSVFLRFDVLSTVHWYFIGKRNSDRYDFDDKPPISVKMNSGQCNQKTIQFEESRGFFGLVSNSVQDFLQFVEHISTLFSVSAGKLHIDSKFTEHLDEIMSVSALKNCPEVWIGGLNSETISHNAMQRALKGFNCKQMRFFCSFDRNFNLPLKSSCESLSMNDSPVTYKHVNVLLHQWIRSEWKKPVDLMFCAGTISKAAEKWGIYGDKCWQEPELSETQEEMWNLKKIAHGLTRYLITYLRKKNVLVFQRDTDEMELRLRIVHYQSASVISLSNNKNRNNH